MKYLTHRLLLFSSGLRTYCDYYSDSEEEECFSSEQEENEIQLNQLSDNTSTIIYNKETSFINSLINTRVNFQFINVTDRHNNSVPNYKNQTSFIDRIYSLLNRKLF